VEVTDRITEDGTRYLFILNHGPARTVPAPVSGTDLLTNRPLNPGEPLELPPTAVLVVRCDPER
jgi:beta-galactosidase